MRDIKVVNEKDKVVFEDKANAYLKNGYTLSSSNCGYAGEVGGNVYDCDYYVAILYKDDEWEVKKKNENKSKRD